MTARLRIFTATCICFLILCVGVGVAQRRSVPRINLVDMLDPKGVIWKIRAAGFEEAYARMGFRWVSTEAKTTSRAYNRYLEFQDHRVVEALARFKNKTLIELTFYFYTRGDMGDITEESFTKQTKKIAASIEAWAGVRGRRMPSGFTSATTRRVGRVWTAPKHQVALEWSFTQLKGRGKGALQPEYIRLRCQSSKVKRSSYASTARANRATRGKMITTTQLRNHVRMAKNGDVHVAGVPMVDQGMKGYCAVATMERIMRYYGREVDQHELAQVSKTSTLGTSPSVMIDVLKKLSVKLACKVRVLEAFSVKDFVRLMDKYNRIAKKKGMRQIEFGEIIYVDQLYASMQPDVLKDVRIKDVGYRKFMANVKKYANKGVPMAWGVVLGVVEEKGLPQAGGGHMRLVIGYNAKTKELLYSDSWGEGHELKRMKMDDAWTITTALYMIQPRGTSL